MRFQVYVVYYLGNSGQKNLPSLIAAHDVYVVAAGSDYLCDGAEIAVINRVDSQSLNLVVMEAAVRERRHFSFGERDVRAGKLTCSVTKVNANELQQRAFWCKAHSLYAMRCMRFTDIQTLEILKTLWEVGTNVYANFAPHTVGGRHPADDDPAVVRVAPVYGTRSLSSDLFALLIR